jgi:pyruvate/2-oxoglutarate/acetoin dehydrogenase E1 component
MDLIELRSLKPLDMATIKASLQRTHKVHFKLLQQYTRNTQVSKYEIIVAVIQHSTARSTFKLF